MHPPQTKLIDVSSPVPPLIKPKRQQLVYSPLFSLCHPNLSISRGYNMCIFSSFCTMSCWLFIRELINNNTKRYYSDTIFYFLLNMKMSYCNTKSHLTRSKRKMLVYNTIHWFTSSKRKMLGYSTIC